MSTERLNLRSRVISLRIVLFGVILLGILFGLAGLGVFLGWLAMDPRDFNVLEHSFFNLTYPTFLAFSTYFVLAGIFMIFPTLDTGERKRIQEGRGLFLFILLIGVELLAYSLLQNAFTTLPMLVEWHSKGDYAVWGIFLVVVSYPILVFTADTLRANKTYYQLSVCIGFVVVGSSVLIYGSSQWWLFFSIGCIFLLMGGLPLILLYISDSQDFLERYGFVFLASAVLGILIYLTPTLVHNNILPRVILGTFSYFDLLLVGALLLVLGCTPLAVSRSRVVFSRLKGFWVALLVIGVGQMIIAVLIASSPGVIDIQFLFPDDALFYMTWDVWWINGAISTLMGLIFITPDLYNQTWSPKQQGLGDPPVNDTLSESKILESKPSQTKKARKGRKNRKPKVGR